MSAVLEPPHEGRGQPDTPTQNTPPTDASPVRLATSTGLKPIQRLTSDSRIDRIVPDSDAISNAEHLTMLNLAPVDLFSQAA